MAAWIAGKRERVRERHRKEKRQKQRTRNTHVYACIYIENSRSVNFLVSR